MKNNYAFCFLILASSTVFGQFPMTATQIIEKGDGKITGTLVDSLSKNGVEFATLALYKSNDLKKPIDGALTDEKGKFIIKNIPNGKFLVKFTSIGYIDKLIKLEEITNKNSHINLGNVLLSSSTKLLNELVVQGQGTIIEERVDRLIYNADKDIAAKGGDATDILRKVPLLTVDLDGNVQLRGSSNIRVLINNKPSSIMAASVADALKQIPADQIKTVEVITSPSSKYDAEGSSGIINIITKKNNIEGYSLNTDIGGGNRGANLGLNGSLKSGKFGMTLGGYGRANFNPSSTEFEQRTKNLTKNITTKQFGDATDKMVFGRYSLGADYDIKKNKSISGGARFGTRSFNRDQELSIERYVDNKLLSKTLQRIESTNPSLNWDFNLDYLHIISPQKELSISALYSRSSANSDFTNTPLGSPELEKLAFTNQNINLNQEYTLQADYQTSIKKNQMLEFGGKGIFRAVNSDFNYLVGGKEINDPNRPNGSLDYNQNIAASYLSYAYATKNKYNFKIGARYEYTDIKAVESQERQIIIPSYDNLVPSINISKTYGGKYTVKTAYNRRIQRPGLTQLNPNLNLVNPQSLQQGNPELAPEIADNIEASLSASIKKVYLNLSVFSRITNNSISQITEAYKKDSSKLLTTFQNVGLDKAYGVNWFGNLSITSKWMLNGGIEAFYNTIVGKTAGLTGKSVEISNQGWNLNARLMSFMTLKKGWQLQAFSFVRGSRVMLMGRQAGFGVYSIGARKDFKNKKGSVGLSTQNFLTQTMKFKTTMESPLFFQNNVNNMFNRGVSLNLSYKLGKMGVDAMQPKKKAKGIKNDDVKDGGGGDNQSQPTGGAPGRG